MTTEAEYQSQLVNAIFVQSQANTAGMQIYKNNWIEGAHNALSISFPTVRILLGDTNFRLLCRFACRTIPRQAYNWEEWGVFGTFVSAVSEFLTLQNTSNLIYVAECAKLDEMLFINQKSADPMINVDLLNTLSQTDPDNTTFTVSNATQLSRFSFPVDKVYKHAHFKEGDITEIRQQLVVPSCYFIQVSRSEFSPSINALSQQEFMLFDMINKGHSITSIFEAANEANIDFISWLGNAISQGVVTGFKHSLHFN